MNEKEIRAFLPTRVQPAMQEVRQWLDTQLDALHTEFAIDTNSKKGNHHEL